MERQGGNIWKRKAGTENPSAAIGVYHVKLQAALHSHSVVEEEYGQTFSSISSANK